jgi:hypothetical protein
MEQEGPDGGDHSMLPRVASPVYSVTSTGSEDMCLTDTAFRIRYRAAREFLTDASNMIKGVVQLLMDHLPHVVRMSATVRYQRLISPCADESASDAVRATQLPPTTEMATLLRKQVIQLDEGMRKSAKRVVRVKFNLRCDNSVDMSIEISNFINAHKYKDDWIRHQYSDRDVLRGSSSRPILCYLYHHLDRMDQMLHIELINIDRESVGYEPIDDENRTYDELLALHNSALLLKLAALLRSCVTMYFHTTFNSFDCDGHAQFLKHLLLRIQNRSRLIRLKERSCDITSVDEEPDNFTLRAAKRQRFSYDDESWEQPANAVRAAAHNYCDQNRNYFSSEVTWFLTSQSP